MYKKNHLYISPIFETSGFLLGAKVYVLALTFRQNKSLKNDEIGKVGRGDVSQTRNTQGGVVNMSSESCGIMDHGWRNFLLLNICHKE